MIWATRMKRGQMLKQQQPQQYDDTELLYITMVGMLMAALIATGYHRELDSKIVEYAPEGTSYPFPATTRGPASIFTLAIGLFMLLTIMCHVCKKIRRGLITRLYSYRVWIYEPKAFKTKMWMLCLKFLLLPESRSLFNFQDVLPKYPLPTLEYTCDRALKNLKPLVSPERYEEIKAEMNKFASGDGIKLQQFLESRYITEENWVSEIWDKYAYLIGRYPLLYTNFCMSGGLKRSDFISCTKDLPQAAVAANQIYHMTKFHELIKSEELESLMMMNIVPICNQRYKYLFATTRVPGLHMDTMRTYEESKHIIVFRKGVMFNLPLYATDSSGFESLLTPAELQRQIELILHHTDEEPVYNPAIFTTLTRPEWTREREKLLMRAQNRESLKQVERALFHVVLEDTSPKNLSEECHSNLCGNGFNRWYDKSYVMTIYANGLTGGNVEHTSVDATLPSRGLEYMFAKMKFDTSGAPIAPSDALTHDQVSPPFRIEWNLDESQTESLIVCQTKHLQQSSNLDMVALQLDNGKGSIKKCRVSPDSFMQMSLQLAFYKLHRTTPKTYETAMTRFFKFGRTETIRTVSMDSVAFTKVMLDPEATKKERLEHLKKAMKSHNDYKLDAMSGRASDRSLFGLMAAAKLSGLEPQPALFDLPEIKSGDRLSTSQSPFVFDQKLSKSMTCYPAGGSFAPQTTDGYGVYYLFLGENNMTIHISSYRCYPETSSEKFGEAIKESMDDIKSLLAK